MAKLRIALAGLGKVGRRFLELLTTQPPAGVQLEVVGVADSRGVYFPEASASARSILEQKRDRRLPCVPGSLLDVGPDVLLEAGPTSLRDPRVVAPIREALGRGVHCVLASKGALVQSFAELSKLSDLTDPSLPCLRFGGAVGSAIPSVNIGRREFVGARLHRLEGVLNITCQRLLGRMEEGVEYDQALAEAQESGSAEGDATMDVDGWDAAAKLVILANAVLGQHAVLSDVQVSGIRTLTSAEVSAARRAGARVALLASAELGSGACRLTVGPSLLASDHPLARVRPTEQGVVFHSALHGGLTVIGQSLGPAGTAAAMLKDVLEIAARSS